MKSFLISKHFFVFDAQTLTLPISNSLDLRYSGHGHPNDHCDYRIHDEDEWRMQ